MKRSDPPSSQRWALYSSHLGDYMRRWIFRTPWGTIRLHNIRKSDEGRDFHDHPFDFTSIILRGGYREHRPGCYCEALLRALRMRPVRGICQTYDAGSVVRRKAEELHRLETDGAWTLVFTGPYLRSWGFQTSEGWVDHKDYHRNFDGEEP
jgi:hypothetical protein